MSIQQPQDQGLCEYHHPVVKMRVIWQNCQRTIGSVQNEQPIRWARLDQQLVQAVL